ncbi:MAG TPA: sulfurtransferase [Bryobacteraceae bacterium]|nr:sulfurtransferase [Bryobacteraceae bacterium]
MTIRCAASRLALAALFIGSAAAASMRSDMLVSSDWLAAHLADPDLVILHVSANRTAYDAGHIPGARFIPQSEIAITRDGIPNELPDTDALVKVFETAGVSDNKRVIVYSDATVLTATRTYFTLDYLGHGDRTALLDGGLSKWRSEGRALTTDVPSVAQGHFTPRIQQNVLAKMDRVKQMSATQAGASDLLLDARPKTDYTGEKGGHIPTALNVYWMEGQVSRENQSLKPEPELRKLYESAGITPDHKVVTYCHSGMQASQAYFTLKYLGYDVSMYDGSISEWEAKGGPLEK